jgi:molybdopterin-guanine dinucleotide biosynthesis protein B
LGFVAPSGTGKTMLLRQVLGLLSAQGLRVGAVKQARDDFDVDQSGKDSQQLRAAGVERLLLTSDGKSALIWEHPQGDEPELDELLDLFGPDSLDLILVEGFSHQPFPKIELHRGPGTPRFFPSDPTVIALVTDRVGEMRAHVPVMDINDPIKVAEFVMDLLWQENS